MQTENLFFLPSTSPFMWNSRARTRQLTSPPSVYSVAPSRTHHGNPFNLVLHSKPCPTIDQFNNTSIVPLSINGILKRSEPRRGHSTQASCFLSQQFFGWRENSISSHYCFLPIPTTITLPVFDKISSPLFIHRERKETTKTP